MNLVGRRKNAVRVKCTHSPVVPCGLLVLPDVVGERVVRRRQEIGRRRHLGNQIVEGSRSDDVTNLLEAADLRQVGDDDVR